ncbi:hypothetical protein A5886_001446 [Enterococcus sp. 8G7_MSG3316]|uniref:Phosphosugar-binding transcriptional regulator n=1 Tax=Candidatus Enterococcus testudinis TaxID=1834191 RepID=A0A242A627_9ENTE|nr:hypothetical protein A5886_001446 [Enterococcus sp. 8G7_MSG3316]
MIAVYLFQKIEEAAVRYNDARKNIGDFLLLKKSKIRDYSMQQIAEQTYTSKTTLFRYAQSMGYSGWKEFLQDFLEEANYTENHYSEVDPNLPFMPNDTTESIVKKITKIQIESLEETADQIDTYALDKATSMILSSRYIVLFGISPNNLLGRVLKRKMESIGIIMSVASVDESGMVSAALKEGDCAVIVSYSGNNDLREPMKYIKPLKDRGVNLIGITGGGNNYIRQNIDCVLTISSRERLYSKISNFTSEESIMHIFNLLYACCFAQNFDENYTHKVQNSQELEYRRNASLYSMREGEFDDLKE